MSMCPPEMPNCFFFVGPNGAPGAGSTIQMSEVTCEYMIKCILKLQRENLKWMKPRLSALFLHGFRSLTSETEIQQSRHS